MYLNKHVQKKRKGKKQIVKLQTICIVTFGKTITELGVATPEEQKKEGKFPLRGWQPHWCLDWSAAATTTQAMPCVLLRQLIRERNLKVPSLKAYHPLVLQWTQRAWALRRILVRRAARRSFPALAAWRPCPQRWQRACRWDWQSRQRMESLRPVLIAGTLFSVCATSQAHYQDFRTVPQSSPVFEFCEVFKTCQPTRNLASWNFQI